MGRSQFCVELLLEKENQTSVKVGIVTTRQQLFRRNRQFWSGRPLRYSVARSDIDQGQPIWWQRSRLRQVGRGARR